MLLDKDFVMQGGVRNYLGETEEVNNAPRYWQSSPTSPKTELSYITDAEKNLLLDANLHGSLKDGKPNKGASGLLSFDGGGYGSESAGTGGNDGFGGGSNNSGGNDYTGSDYGFVVSQPPAPTPSDNNTVDPGFQEALRQQAIQQLALGDPDPQVDVSPEDRDSITSFLDNYAANVKSNPLMLGTIGALKTLYQTQQARDMMAGLPGYGFLQSSGGGDTTNTGGGGEQDYINNAISQLPYAMTGTTPQDSMVNQYFSNLNTSGSGLSSDLQTSYNNAKNNISSILGTNQQFGYSAQPYGLLSSTNMADNPFNIPYLQQRGLI